MLRGHQEFPFVARPPRQARPRIEDKVPEDALLQLDLRVRRVDAAELIEAGQQGAARVTLAAIDAAIPPAPRNWIGLLRGQSVNQLAESGLRPRE
jgi:hypothetical protein